MSAGRGMGLCYRYQVFFRHPKTGEAGLALLLSEHAISEEVARLKARGWVVTKVVRPTGTTPKVNIPRQSRGL
jgi:hypothetical protein